jgi:uncharacterized protein YegP (UPF0339 family)
MGEGLGVRGYRPLLTTRKTLITYYCYYQDKKGEWRWRLKASNGRIFADLGEGYKNLKDCLDDIARVKDSKSARVEKEG